MMSPEALGTALRKLATPRILCYGDSLTAGYTARTQYDKSFAPWAPLLADAFGAGVADHQVRFLRGSHRAQRPTLPPVPSAHGPLGADFYQCPYIPHDWDDEKGVAAWVSGEAGSGSWGATVAGSTPHPGRDEDWRPWRKPERPFGKQLPLGW